MLFKITIAYIRKSPFLFIGCSVFARKFCIERKRATILMSLY